MHVFRCLNAECVRQIEAEGFFFGEMGECPDCGNDAETAFVDDGFTHLLVMSPDGPLGFWGSEDPNIDIIRQPRGQYQAAVETVRTGAVRGFVACRPKLAKLLVRMSDKPDRVTCPECRKRGAK